jgi:hypothetical protein
MKFSKPEFVAGDSLRNKNVQSNMLLLTTNLNKPPEDKLIITETEPLVSIKAAEPTSFPNKDKINLNQNDYSPLKPTINKPLQIVRPFTVMTINVYWNKMSLTMSLKF